MSTSSASNNVTNLLLSRLLPIVHWIRNSYLQNVHCTQGEGLAAPAWGWSPPSPLEPLSPASLACCCLTWLPARLLLPPPAAARRPPTNSRLTGCCTASSSSLIPVCCPSTLLHITGFLEDGKSGPFRGKLQALTVTFQTMLSDKLRWVKMQMYKIYIYQKSNWRPFSHSGRMTPTD